MGRTSRKQDRSSHGARIVLPNTLGLRHAARLMTRVCTMIRKGILHPGDRLPPERELARLVRISSSSVCIGIHHLAAIGVLKMRPDGDAFVASGAEELVETALVPIPLPEEGDLGCLCEACRVLPGNLAALAAERCGGKYWMRLAEELAELYVAVDDPSEYLAHELAFHRTIARAAGNPVLCGLMTRIIFAMYGAHRESESSSDARRDSADRHRRIFRAIRNRKPEEARRAVEDHLRVVGNAVRQGRAPEEANHIGPSSGALPGNR